MAHAAGQVAHKHIGHTDQATRQAARGHELTGQHEKGNAQQAERLCAANQGLGQQDVGNVDGDQHRHHTQADGKHKGDAQDHQRSKADGQKPGRDAHLASSGKLVSRRWGWVTSNSSANQATSAPHTGAAPWSM